MDTVNRILLKFQIAPAGVGIYIRHELFFLPLIRITVLIRAEKGSYVSLD
jgi:hypothetical protein